MFSLKEKVVLVTGAGAGIGEAIALSMAKAGATLALADRNDAQLHQVCASASELGVSTLPIVADCSKVESIYAMVRQTVEHFGRLDVIVNNAGVNCPNYVTETDEAEWDFVNAVNSKGVFFGLQAAAKQFIAQGGGGRIINIASIGARGFANASSVAYAASKGAVLGMTRLAAHQLAKHDITVNAICPGVTMTPLAMQTVAMSAKEAGISSEEYVAQAAKMFPLGRANDPEDMGAMAVFLASDEARNITGQSYNVDGGLVMS
ncbi:SDR family oxidoreductase [Pseudomonas sp. BN415]|uniref:SDR family NAD(P)-dependent oxidoreductase n=1 Tax=Pseudomonas sp. BN415 TaxID=2567889 RepID=UPI0024565E56|nr:SDR family oxidoreductase [Pseudomonas sp. BN415]MDH4580739.1 SDR family oxidoreductase [Pseudomonas sp. BN415]